MKQQNRREKVLMGKFGVDSGQLMIFDPVYGENFNEHFSYKNICEQTLSKDRFGVLHFHKSTDPKNGMAVVSSTVIGDGTFSVYGHYDNMPGFGKRLRKITIELW